MSSAIQWKSAFRCFLQGSRLGPSLVTLAGAWVTLFLYADVM